MTDDEIKSELDRLNDFVDSSLITKVQVNPQIFMRIGDLEGEQQRRHGAVKTAEENENELPFL